MLVNLIGEFSSGIFGDQFLGLADHTSKGSVLIANLENLKSNLLQHNLIMALTRERQLEDLVILTQGQGQEQYGRL